MRRTHRLHLRSVHGWPVRSVDCLCEFQVGRFRKQKALGCGRSRCRLCHFEKIFGIPSVRDRNRRQRSVDSFKDYSIEVNHESAEQAEA